MPVTLAGRDFHRAVAETVIGLAAVPIPGPDRHLYPDIVGFVDGQLAAMPAHLRLGVEAAAGLLAAITFARHRQRFEQLPAGTRSAVVERWTASRLPTTQLYMRMMRQLTLFAAYECADEAA